MEYLMNWNIRLPPRPPPIKRILVSVDKKAQRLIKSPITECLESFRSHFDIRDLSPPPTHTQSHCHITIHNLFLSQLFWLDASHVFIVFVFAAYIVLSSNILNWISALLLYLLHVLVTCELTSYNQTKPWRGTGNEKSQQNFSKVMNGKLNDQQIERKREYDRF